MQGQQAGSRDIGLRAPPKRFGQVPWGGGGGGVEVARSFWGEGDQRHEGLHLELRTRRAESAACVGPSVWEGQTMVAQCLAFGFLCCHLLR